MRGLASCSSNSLQDAVTMKSSAYRTTLTFAAIPFTVVFGNISLNILSRPSKAIFASTDEIIPPCGVPSSVSHVTVPSLLSNRPSLPLTLTTLAIVCVAILRPYTPLASYLGFTPLPGLYFLFLAGMTLTYLLLVELVKRRLMRWTV